MNWSERYAVSQKSLQFLRIKLPEGWDVRAYGQPADALWHEERAVRKKPYRSEMPWDRLDIVSVHNPKTNNRMWLYDTEHFFSDRRAQHIFQHYWNPIQHGDFIHAFASHLDKLGSGITLNLARNNAPMPKNKRNTVSKPNTSFYDFDFDQYIPDDHPSGADAWVVTNLPETIEYNKFQNINFNKPSRPSSQYPVVRSLADEFDDSNRGSYIQNWLHALTHEHGHVISNNLESPKAKKEYTTLLSSLTQRKGLDDILEATKASDYGASRIEEHFAEHYAYYRLGTQSANPDITEAIGRHYGWGKL